MTDNDPGQVPPPSAPPPQYGQPPVSRGPIVTGQVAVDTRVRGSLGGAYNAYAGQGYSPDLTNVAAHFRNIAQYEPDLITRGAQRFDLTPNSGYAFISEGPFVAQYSMANGRYNLGRVYAIPHDQYDLDLTQQRLATVQNNIDPYSRVGIEARHALERIALDDPGTLARQAHIYPNANLTGGEAYFVSEIGGRPYGMKYNMVDGRFEPGQMFDMDPRSPESQLFLEQERNARIREDAAERAGRRIGGYGPIPTPYPIGRGGPDVGVVIDSGRRGSEVGVRVGDRRNGTDVGVVVDTGRGGVHVGGQVDVRLPGGGRIDVGGIFKPK